MAQTVADILHNCKLFSAVGDRGLQRLATIARISRFNKGESAFRQGDDCPGAYVVGSGLVRVFKTGAGGKEHALHIVGPGNTFAEVAAIGGFRCPAHAESLEPTACAVLPTDLLRKAMEEDHELCLGMMTGMARWVRHLIGLLEDIVLRDAAGRLARFLLDSKRDESGTIELPGLKRHVANHLNLTSETFSRIFRRFTEAELIAELPEGRIRLADSHKLAQVAEGLAPRL